MKMKMKTEGKYIINEQGEVVPEYDLLAWARWIETAKEKRILKRDQIGDLLVSTVFLGLDYDFTHTKPILWETMVFKKNGKSDDDYFSRYSTKEEALKGHEENCKTISNS